MQSNLQRKLHIGVIMDGNGRWATAQGRPRLDGHVAGVEAVRRVAEAAAADGGIGLLTLYAFSSDNWRRPRAEVNALMRLFRTYLAGEAERLARQDIRLSVIGRRSRLPEGLAETIAAVEAATARGGALHLRLAIDYSARNAIVAAAARAALHRGLTRARFARLIARDGAAQSVDLVIRTGGEKRLSDFLLWECAYAELYFTDTMWPAFGRNDLSAALADFRRRDRRYGALTAAAA